MRFRENKRAMSGVDLPPIVVQERAQAFVALTREVLVARLLRQVAVLAPGLYPLALAVELGAGRAMLLGRAELECSRYVLFGGEPPQAAECVKRAFPQIHAVKHQCARCRPFVAFEFRDSRRRPREVERMLSLLADPSRKRRAAR